MDEKFIAYKGKKFTIEWYFNTKNKSEALDYFEELTPDRQKKMAHLLRNAYEKKSQKMPPREKERALKI